MHFEKVSYEQFITDCKEFEDNPRILESFYNNIKLPKRATKDSAGYDFFAPYKITIAPHDTILIPTGVRWVATPLDFPTVLMLYIRSGLGFKYGLRLTNGTGIIDADYMWSDNEGHIMVKLHNPSEKEIIIEQGKGFCQGVLLPFCIIDNDETHDLRNGGFGSTDK